MTQHPYSGETVWRTDEFGRPEAALYMGRLCVGSVNLLVPEGWREWELYKNPPPADEHVKKNIASSRKYYEATEAVPWRAWFHSDESGEEIGRYPTKDDAKAALELCLAAALTKDTIAS